MNFNGGQNRQAARESTIEALRAELRLHYFSATQLIDERVIHFDTGKCMFYGHKTEFAKGSYDSESGNSNVQSGYVGLLLFYGGETYVGEMDAHFRPHGNGMLFFSVGAAMRSKFVDGRVHNAALISMQTDVNVLARFDRGVLNQYTLKLDYRCRVATELHYAQGRFQKYERERHIDDKLLADVRHTLGTNSLPDDVRGFTDGSMHFGTFISSADSLYYGFVRNGRPVGWGVTVGMPCAALSRSVTQESLNWRLSNNCGETESVAVGLNQDGNMVFGREQSGILCGEIGVYYPRDNSFQHANVRGGILEFEAECSEGVQKKFVSGIYLQYVNELQLPRREVPLLPIVFDLTYFNDRFFFYLYGLLKAQSRELFQDNLQLGRGDFGQLSGVPDAETEGATDSMHGNARLNTPHSEDGALFELHSRNKERAHNVQSEVTLRRLASSGGIDNSDREQSQSVDAKLSLTVGADDERNRRKSSFARPQYRHTVTSKHSDALTIIHEAQDEMRKSKQLRDTQRLDTTDEYAHPRSIQSQLHRSQMDLQVRGDSASDAYDSTMLVENSEEKLCLPETLEPRQLYNGSNTQQQMHNGENTAGERVMLIQQIRAQLQYILPPTLMQQLKHTNPRFFGA